MPRATTAGPGGYADVSGQAGTPHPDAAGQAPPAQATPFTPPDISGLGYGQAAGGAAGPGGTSGGSLADQISGTSGLAGRLASMGGEAAEAAAL